MFEKAFAEKLRRLQNQIDELKALESGGVIDHGLLDGLGDDDHPQYMLAIVPSARAYNNANISIPNNTITTLTFDSERWDTDTIHSTSTNPARLTCKTAGIYSIFANVEWASNSTGVRSVLFTLNGTSTTIASVGSDAFGTAFNQIIHTQYRLAVNDYILCRVYQNSGGALNVRGAANYTPEFGMTYLGKVA